MKILIPTQTKDMHSYAVQQTLSTMGHEGVRLFCSDFPTKMTMGINLGEGMGGGYIKSSESVIEANEIDVVWRRRLRKPFVPPGMLNIHDAWIARNESDAFWTSFWSLIETNAIWVNSNEGANLASQKTLQLKVAVDLKFKIPKSLISNDPAAIKDFLSSSNAPNIYKMFRPTGWAEGSDEAVALTSKVEIADLPSDRTLMAVPGIYQSYVEKDYELRVTFMGDYYVALKIYSQSGRRSKIDWRYTPLTEFPTELIQLDQSTYEFCRNLMKRLGILFGAFDFISSKDGETIFLEVNEAGQFLFIEQLHPECRLLQSFCEFLTRPGIDFQPTFNDRVPGFLDLINNADFIRAYQAADACHLTEPVQWHPSVQKAV